MFKENMKKIFTKSMVTVMLLALTQSSWAFMLSGDELLALNTATPSILNLNTPTDRDTSPIRLRGTSTILNPNLKVSISLRDSDVRQVLRMLADKAKMNIVFHESVEGKITLDLVNVTLKEAFMFVMETTGLSYYIEDKTIVVASIEATRSSSFAKQTLTVLPVKYVNATNVAKFLNENVYSSDSKGGNSESKVATSNPRTNEIMIFGTRNDAEVAKKVISRLDTRPIINTFKVTHTTPKQMAKLICNTLFKEGDSDSGSSDSESDSEDDSDSDSGSSEGGSSDSSLSLGGGTVACKAGEDSGSGGGSSEEGAFKAQATTIVYMNQLGEVGIYGGSYEQAELVRDFIIQHDRKQPMAYLEMNIIELNESGSNEFNNTWNIATPFATLSFDGTNGLSFGTVNVLSATSNSWHMLQTNQGGISATDTLSWLIKDGKGRTLSNPRIMSTNGQKSTIDLTSDYIKTVTSQTTTTAGATPIVTKTYEIANDNGLKIEITPFISPEGYISLNITPEFASIKQKIYSTAQGAKSPTDEDLVATLLQRRDLELKNIRIRDGETLILAGFVTENETQATTKFPILGDLPVIGAFFRSSKNEKAKEELVIMITPHIVYSEEEMERIKNLKL